MTALSYKQATPREIAKASFLYPANFALDTKKPIIVEVGPGRGDFLFHLAEQNPQSIIVGIEIKGKRVDRLIQRTEKRNLKNILIIQDDARSALPSFFAKETVDEIHINFPDPWPKNKHEKNRAISSEFLNACSNTLKVNRTISITTDHESYAMDIMESIKSIDRLKGVLEKTILTEMPNAYPTFFSEKWKSEGRKIFYQKYRKF